jgi:naphtho-gamma-pyrone polyketide synthase
LFLFPDGSGSAASYATLGKLGSNIAVVGLNCPFMKEPHLLSGSLEAYVRYFVTELRRRQSQGPYFLGGWSAGGILAFEAAKQLLQAGETIARLVLIDSPNPIGLENPPSRLYDFFDELGLFGFGSGSAPKWLRPHFDAFLTVLNEYASTISSTPREISTSILYARDGLVKGIVGPKPELRDDDPREMRWLLEDRTDFQADGWKQLVGGATAVRTIEVLDSVNHFSLMAHGSHMATFASLLQHSLD